MTSCIAELILSYWFDWPNVVLHCRALFEITHATCFSFEHRVMIPFIEQSSALVTFPIKQCCPTRPASKVVTRKERQIRKTIDYTFTHALSLRLVRNQVQLPRTGTETNGWRFVSPTLRGFISISFRTWFSVLSPRKGVVVHSKFGSPLLFYTVEWCLGMKKRAPLCMFLEHNMAHITQLIGRVTLSFRNFHHSSFKFGVVLFVRVVVYLIAKPPRNGIVIETTNFSLVLFRK